jgi:ferredoxin
MRVVFPSGEVRDLEADDPWFDRFFGTEGQFGVITRIALRVRERPKEVVPVLLSFGADEEAFAWIHSMMEEETVCNHIKFMGPHLLNELNRFYGEPLIDSRPSVLAVFEDGENREPVWTGSGRWAPEYLARFLWHERLFPLRLSQAGSSLLASEAVFDDRDAPGYVEKARRLAQRLGFDLLVEAHSVGSHRLLLIPHFLAQPRRTFHYGLALALTSMLTQMAVDHGGMPYGVGIWNSPFIRDRFDGESLNALRRWKKQVDPDHLLNPSRYFGVRTRFFNIPGQAFNPLVFRILMRTLTMSSPLWAWMGQMLGSGTVKPSKALTPMERTALLCSRCGSCLSVCPAYRVKGDEALAARSKLRLIRGLSQGPGLSPEDARKIFLCLHCGACEQSCQSRLSLVDTWEGLEKRVAETSGTPIDAINTFINEMDESEEYGRMVDRW